MGITSKVRRSAAAVAVLGMALSLAPPISVAEAATGTSSISGSVFDDANRNGVRDAGEAPFAGQQLYLFDGAMTSYHGTTLADSGGRYSFAGLADGNYIVQLEDSAWRAIRHAWVPTTTGSIFPRHPVSLAGEAAADFGWRPIVRSSTFGSPISLYVAPNGMRVESYDDVVTARQLFHDVMLGLVGPEAASVTIRFDFGDGGDTTTTGVSRAADGRYENFGADVYASYLSWLDSGDAKLIHEYGHAWSLYHAYITQQDPTLASYLAARGLTGDSRLGSSHAWSPKEMIAEDYRQLFGSPTASTASQENRAIPPAAAVPGLLAFLRDTFTTPPAGTPTTTTAVALAVSSVSVNPNPVRTTGTISWSTSVPAQLTVTILSAKGSVVRTLLSGAAGPAGVSSVDWDRLSDRGRRAGKGTYTAKIVADDGAGGQATNSVSFSVV